MTSDCISFYCIIPSSIKKILNIYINIVLICYNECNHVTRYLFLMNVLAYYVRIYLLYVIRKDHVFLCNDIPNKPSAKFRQFSFCTK